MANDDDIRNVIFHLNLDDMQKLVKVAGLADLDDSMEEGDIVNLWMTRISNFGVTPFRDMARKNIVKLALEREGYEFVTMM